MSYPILALRFLHSPPGLPRLLVLPLLINIVLLTLFVVGGILAYNPLYERLITEEETLLATLGWWFGLVVYLLALIVIVIYSFMFVGTVVAGPFFEPISRRVEAAILGAPAAGESGRGFLRESVYSITQAGGMIIVAIVSFVIIGPLALCLPVVGPLIALPLGSWVVALEFMDACFARKRYPLGEKIRFVSRNKAVTLGFGLAIQAFLLVPFLNCVALPIGAAAATMMYLDAGGKSPPPPPGAASSPGQVEPPADPR